MSSRALAKESPTQTDGWGNAESFKACAWSWADRIGVRPARIQLRGLTKKWASCSAARIVTFSRDLLSEDREFGESVIVHELLHLKVPNHGPVFKSLMSAYLPRRHNEMTENRLSSRGKPAAK